MQPKAVTPIFMLVCSRYHCRFEK